MQEFPRTEQQFPRSIRAASFHIGQIVQHKLYDYRGVVIDVDPSFRLSEAWYEANATANSPRDKPWYHILVHETGHRTYVPERSLVVDECPEPVNHPDVPHIFRELRDGSYVLRKGGN